MSREKQGYAEALIGIRAAFPGRESLRIGECARYLGIDRHTAAKRIARNAAGVVLITDFARQIAT